MSKLMNQAIIAILRDDLYEALFDVYQQTLNYHWYCEISKQAFIEMILTAYQNPDKAYCYLSGLRLLRDNYYDLEVYSYHVHQIMKKRLLRDYNPNTIGIFNKLPQELCQIISNKI